MLAPKSSKLSAKGPTAVATGTATTTFTTPNIHLFVAVVVSSCSLFMPVGRGSANLSESWHKD